MRINRLDLTRYGKFTDKHLDFGAARAGSPDFHLVYGPNEAGKSTLFSAYLDLLFGIEAQSGYGFLHPYATMRIGGNLTIGTENFGVARLKRRQGSLVTPDDRALPDTLFGAALGSMDRQAYQMMFSLDDESIERGGESILKSEGELGALLFSASSGLSNIGAALERLKTEADSFYRPQARKHELATMKAELEALREERKEINVAARDYGVLTRQLESSAARYDEAFTARAGTKAAIEDLERKLNAMPLLARLRDVRARLAEFELGDPPPKEWSALVGQLLREEAELSARGDRLKIEREQRQVALDGLQDDPVALVAEAEISALAGSQLEARYQTAGMDLSGRMAERERIDVEILEKQALLGLPTGEDPSVLILPPDKAAAISALVTSHSALGERLAAARREADEAVTACDSARAKAASIAGGTADSDDDEARTVLSTLVRATRQNALSTRLREAERQVAAAETGLRTSLSRLAPWRSNVDGLRTIIVPGKDKLALLRQSARRHADAAIKLSEQTRQAEVELAGQRAGLDRLRRTEALVGDDEALQLRSSRDSAWKEHRAELAVDTADRFEQAMLEFDRAAEQRLAHADRLSELRLTERSAAEIDARLDTMREDFQRIASDGMTVAGQVDTIAERLGLSSASALQPRRPAPASLGAAATPLRAVSDLDDDPEVEIDVAMLMAALDRSVEVLDAIEEWLGRRTAALEADDLLIEHRSALAVVKDEAADLSMRLSQALALGEPSASSAVDIDELLVRAEDRAAALGESIASRRTLLESFAQAEVRRVERQTALDAAEATMAAWQGDWERACAGTWLSREGTAMDAQRAGALLPVIHAASRLVEARRELDRRIEGMRRDQADYGRNAMRLAEKMGETPASDPLQQVAAFAARLRAAKEIEARREALRADLAGLDGAVLELGQRVAVHEQRVRDICDALDCNGLANASLVLEQHRKREDLRERADEAAHNLARAMLMQTADEAEAALAATDEGELAADLGRLRATYDDQDTEVRELHAARIKAADALAAIGADGSAAALEERRRTLLMDMADRATSYLSTRAGIAAAEGALRLYRERHRSAMMRHASDAFHTISGGEYSGLSTVIEKDQEILVAAAASGGTKLARELSKGTRFQLYLALRVAGYHEVAANRESLPFIADDIMETFDDGRSLNAFRLMADMSKVGQVIYLTHHQHLCDIARKACPQVVVHEL